MSTELVATAAVQPLATLDTFDTALAAERAAELTLMRSIMKSIVIGVPLGIAFFIVLMTFAVAGDAEWYVIVGIGSIMGVVAAVMFGMLGGVTLVAHVLEDVDRGTSTH